MAYYTSLMAAILIGIAGQIALKSGWPQLAGIALIGSRVLLIHQH